MGKTNRYFNISKCFNHDPRIMVNNLQQFTCSARDFIFNFRYVLTKRCVDSVMSDIRLANKLCDQILLRHVK